MGTCGRDSSRRQIFEHVKERGVFASQKPVCLYEAVIINKAPMRCNMVSHTVAEQVSLTLEI